MIVQLLLMRQKQTKMADDNKEVEYPAPACDRQFKETLEAKYKYFQWRLYTCLRPVFNFFFLNFSTVLHNNKILIKFYWSEQRGNLRKTKTLLN